MSWPENPQLDQDRYDIPLLENLDALKDAIGSPTAIASQGARLTTAEGTLATQGGRILTEEKRSTSQARGLVAPNPAVSLLRTPPTAMASPPTITPGTAGGSTAITNSVLIAPDNAALTYYGSRVAFGPTYPNTLFYSNVYVFSASTTPGTYGYARSPFSVEFMWYGADFELYLKGASAHYRLSVDDLGYDTRAGRQDYASTGSLYLVKYAFGSAAARRIRFDFDAPMAFGGIRIGPNDSIWKTQVPRGPKVAVIGDSFVEGTAAVNAMNTSYEMAGWLLGWRDVLKTGWGSTGYLANGSGSKTTYRTRLQKDVIDVNPDIVIVTGGINDSAATPAALQAEAVLLFTAIRSGLPNAALIVQGMQNSNGTVVSGTAVQNRDAIRAAAASVGVDLYIEEMGGPYPYSGTIGNYTDAGWMTGTGKVGSTTGSGNSDIFREADGTHPTLAGHDYRGYRAAQAIAAAMPILGAS